MTHALFGAETEDLLRRSGVAHLWSSDSIPHPSNAFTLVPQLSEALLQLKV